MYPHFELYPSLHVLPTSSQATSVSQEHPVTTIPVPKAATSISSVEPWGHSWPYRKADISSPANERHLASLPLPVVSTPRGVNPRQLTQPSRKATLPQPADPWAHSWPYRKATVSEATRPIASVVALTDESKPKVPVQPWAHSWPYRTPSVTMNSPVSDYGRYPCLVICRSHDIKSTSMSANFDQIPPCILTSTCTLARAVALPVILAHS